MSSRGYPKRSARAAGVNSYSSSRRPRRSGAGSGGGGGGGGVVVSTENLGVPAVPWTKVLRYPSAPLDEPYYGRSPRAYFKIPIWVRVDELTEEEKAIYDEEEKYREEQRALWKKDLEKSRDDDEAAKEESAQIEDFDPNVEVDAQASITEENLDTTYLAMEVNPIPELQTAGEEQNQNENTQGTILDGSTVESEKFPTPAESITPTTSNAQK